MREGRLVTNASLRQLGLDRHDDTSALSDLVGRGLAVSFDGRRYAKYVLAATTPRDTQTPGARAPGERCRIRTTGTCRHRRSPVRRLLDGGTTTTGERGGRRDRLPEIDALFDTGRADRTLRLVVRVVRVGIEATGGQG